MRREREGHCLRAGFRDRRCIPKREVRCRGLFGGGFLRRGCVSALRFGAGGPVRRAALVFVPAVFVLGVLAPGGGALAHARSAVPVGVETADADYEGVTASPVAAAESDVAGSAAGDRDALEAFYDATGGDNWKANTNWKTTASLGAWHGVTVNSDGRVIRIHLNSNALTGSIPAEIGNLTELENLNLGSNGLSGAIPAELGGLAKLEYLGLFVNALTGSIPVEIGDLAAVEEIWLQNNALTGSIPVEIGALATLEKLALADNDLTGSIPVELGGLTKLNVLSLRSNGLTGSIPVELGDLTKLTVLDLRSNGLTGSIPAELGNLTALESLSLGDNGLTGSIPVWIGDLTALRALILHDTALTSSIPVEIGNLTALELLWLQGSALTGSIPVEIGNLAKLEFLTLDSNRLTGSIPVEIGNLTALELLLLNGNALTGSIPAELGGLTELEELSLGDNALTGSIPVEIGDLAKLEKLYLHDNTLTGAIPVEIGYLTRLQELWLNGNALTGEVPATFQWLRLYKFYAGGGNDVCVPSGLLWWYELIGVRDDPVLPVCSGITVSPRSLTVTEGDSAKYAVVLTTRPSGDVTVTPSVAAGSDSDIMLGSVSSLVFTTTSWSTAQDVWVKAAEDGDAANGSATIEHAVSGGGYAGVTASSVTVVTAVAPVVNAAPSFTSSATFSAAENQTAVGTVAASDSDTDDSVTAYAIHGGADASKFSIAPASGELTFASAPNYEAPADADAGNDYVVVVQATSGAGERVKTAEQTITVTVTDVGGEAPGVPVAPSVSSASVTSVNVSWTAPSNAGPAITDYDYRYRVTSPVGNWTEVTTTTITALSATIGQLAENTEYDVQVQATNGEGTSDWSGSGSGSTDANASPSFTSPETFSAPENQTAVGTVAASDSDTDDSVTGYAIQGGADASKFSIAPASGALTFASAPNFEAPADADTDGDYVVVVRATSGAGERVKTADQTITVTVTDVDGEAPGVPAAPTVSSASVTSVNVSWTAPANAGPAIRDYDYRYRVTSPVGNWTEVTTTTITALGATITELAENARYDVQVRAMNDEGTSGWSDSGSGSTDANAAPSFISPATFNAPENRTVVGTVTASDSDTGDSVTGYAIQGGADRSKFSLVASTGVLTFASAPNFEAPADTDTGNDYVVVVRATSGAGARAKTADQTITVTVTDVGGEAPGVPAAPLVSSASVTSVTAAWIAPANAGPAITDYDYRYRVTSPQGSWTEVTNTTITALSATITQLTEDTEYDVQVRATNDEGTSGWSDPGTGTPTGATEAGAISNAPENLQATAGDAEVTLRWDAPNNDSGADITGYAYRYKESGGDFIAYTDIPESGPGEANARSYTVTELTNGVEYVFHVRALNQHGGGLPAEATVTLPGIVSSESEELPAEVTLSANYPNPFNPETTIRYALPQAGQVRLVVYDLLGHEVAVLVDQSRPAGNHTVRFGAGNLSSGLYVYRLHAGDETIVRTMMLVK